MIITTTTTTTTTNKEENKYKMILLYSFKFMVKHQFNLKIVWIEQFKS